MQAEKRWLFPSASTPGLEYVITYMPGALEEWKCECKGFQYRGICRHVKLCMNEHEAGKTTVPMFIEGAEDESKG